MISPIGRGTSLLESDSSNLSSPTKDNMKIGFYGSSHCADVSSPHSERFHYTSYIQQLKEKLNLDIVHLGNPSIGNWDIILRQYQELLSNVPDIAVFIWAGPGYLYTKKFREIAFYSGYPESKFQDTNPDLWPVVNLYFENLYDINKDRIEQIAAFTYFDEILSKDIGQRCKIVHVWEGDLFYFMDADLSNSKFIKDYQPPYVWKTGVQLKTSLMGLSICGEWPRRPTLRKILEKDPRPNHIDSDEKNLMLTNWILEALDRYQNGLVLDKTSQLVNLYNTYLEINKQR